MDFDRSFSIGLAWRVAAIALAMFALLYCLGRADLLAAKLLAAGLVVAALATLWTYIRRTNVEVARFVQAVTYGDLSQGFATSRRGGGFDLLGRQLDAAIRVLREERATTADTGRFHAALVDEAPVALIVIEEDRVELVNRAARNLLGKTQGVRIDDFAVHGVDLVTALRGSGRRIAMIELDGRPQRAVLTGTAMHRLGRPLRLLAIQPLQGELDALEMAAQADLVRVLTHEIMNSMTPVTSLARTAATLMSQVDGGADPAIMDARTAVETLARRAEGIMNFVEGYRAFVRTPTIRPRRFSVKPWAEEMARLFKATAEGRHASVSVSVMPADLMLYADLDLLAQAILNLLKNSAEAARESGADPSLQLAIRSTPDSQVSIKVFDNGPGIAPEHAGDIFLPFFTTKPDGTGIGLSLVRRIVSAHGGTIAVHPQAKGACIEMLV